MKLIKINEDHYIIVDDSEIKEGDWLYSFDNSLIVQANSGSANTINSKSLNGRGYGKITHSTQPLGIGWQQEVIELSLQEVKELIGEVNVEKKAESYKNKKGSIPTTKLEDEIFKLGYKDGYNQALEDNKDKKYTEEDLKYMFDCGRNFQMNADITFTVARDFIQPKTEWEVEYNKEKLTLKSK